MGKIKKCYLFTKVIFIFYRNNLENTVSLAHPYIYIYDRKQTPLAAINTIRPYILRNYEHLTLGSIRMELAAIQQSWH